MAWTTFYPQQMLIHTTQIKHFCIYELLQIKIVYIIDICCITNENTSGSTRRHSPESSAYTESRHFIYYLLTRILPCVVYKLAEVTVYVG